MATFFPNSNDQRYAAPMLYLRESLPSSYSESPVIPSNMMMYMNNYSSSSGPCTGTLAGNSNDIPPGAASASTPPHQEILSNLGGSRIGEHDFNGWGNGRGEMPFMPPMGSAIGILQGVQNLQGQGLSLSLSTQIPSTGQVPSMEYRGPNSGFSSFLNPLSISGEGLGGNSDSMKPDMSAYGMSSVARIIPNSKYLKAAQQLLDEVVNVRNALKQQDSKKGPTNSSKEDDHGGSKNETTLPSGGVSSNPQDSASNSPSELSAAEKQDLQNKLTKLLSMLDEVDRRYKQYYHQMQIVVSSFDVIAGCGAAKPYTALALQTISRHFRCLRDTITGQIRVSRRSLGEQDASANGKGVGISRLRYVDQHLRQQRALQQLGMMQQHAWRPQRGLPESSVSVLRAWLFEHFLHPYPKDSDKIMLARQTGLTRSQVSNWFINARVRLWKPMVEEMYKEEAGDAEMDSNSSSEVAPKATNGDNISASEDRGEDLQHGATSTATEQCSTGQQFLDSKHDHVPDLEMLGTTSNTNFQNGTHGGTEIEYGVAKTRPSVDEGSVFPDTIVESDGGTGRYMTSAYHFSELGRFGNGIGVSLTLGLQHCEGGGGIPMSVDQNHHGFVSVRGDEVYNTASSSMGPQTSDFDTMDSGNRQHRYSSSHLLHDFVA